MKADRPTFYTISVPEANSTTYNVESDNGILVEDMPTVEAANAIAVLACLGHLFINEYGDIVITQDLSPGEVPDYQIDDSEYGTDDNEDDDGPVSYADDDETSLAAWHQHAYEDDAAPIVTSPGKMTMPKSEVDNA